MARFSSWWRRRAGPFVACLMVVLALFPAFDAAICETDEPPAAHVLAVQLAAGTADHPGHTESSGLCAHGHFHQTASETPACAFRAPLRGGGQRFAPAPSSVAVLDRHFPPIRPPRA